MDNLVNDPPLVVAAIHFLLQMQRVHERFLTAPPIWVSTYLEQGTVKKPTCRNPEALEHCPITLNRFLRMPHHLFSKLTATVTAPLRWSTLAASCPGEWQVTATEGPP